VPLAYQDTFPDHSHSLIMHRGHSTQVLRNSSGTGRLILISHEHICLLFHRTLLPSDSAAFLAATPPAVRHQSHDHNDQSKLTHFLTTTKSSVGASSGHQRSKP